MRVRECRLGAAIGLSALAVVVGTATAAASADAQEIKPLMQWQARADVIASSATVLQLGGGVNVPAGYYVRFGIDFAGGPQFVRGRTELTARTDIVSRFLLDPFSESRRGLYGGGGVSARWTAGQGWREYLVVLAGLEGPAHSKTGWRSAIEAGFGGGTRVGVVLRRARAGSR